MLTPVFEMKQDEQTLTVLIHAPMAKISDSEISLHDQEIVFSSTPYYLRLYLPGRICVDEDQAQCRYLADKNSFELMVPKARPHEFFPRLDMLTLLLTPNKKKKAHIEEYFPEEQRNANSSEIDEQADTDSEDEFLFEQELPTDSSSITGLTCDQCGYGFAGLKSGLLAKVQEEVAEIITIRDPGTLTIEDRSSLCFQQEADKFSEDHYLADLYDDDEIQTLLKFKIPFESWKSDALSTDEQSRLKELPRRSYDHLSKSDQHSCCLSLTDILFAYLYAYRTNEGDENVEWPWTVNKLSGTLSCLVQHASVHAAAVSCFRRALCYPLHRHWGLCSAVWSDLRQLLASGPKVILKCLLHVHEMFNREGDFRHLLNELYITDYCVWIQGLRVSILDKLCDEVQKMNLKKEEVMLDLEAIELAGQFEAVSVESPVDATAKDHPHDSSIEAMRQRAIARDDSDDD